MSKAIEVDEDKNAPGSGHGTRPTVPLTFAEIAEIEARLELAHKKVSALCNGDERWTMRIPADPDYDHDLIISVALRDGDRLAGDLKRRICAQGDLQNEVDKLRDALTRISLIRCGVPGHSVAHDCGAPTIAANALARTQPTKSREAGNNRGEAVESSLPHEHGSDVTNHQPDSLNEHGV